MTLRILLPHQVFLDEEVTKVVAEAENGSFGLLPRHQDFVTALTAGLLSYVTTANSEERFVAVDAGILVKCGPEVVVSTRRAVAGADLGELQQTVQQEFLTFTDDERRARATMARLETSLARRFIEFQRHA